MQPTTSPLQNFWQNTSITKKVAIIFLPLAIIIIIVISIISIYNNTPAYDQATLENAKHLTINNFNTVAPDIPEFYQLEVRSTIWQILHDYNNISSDIYTSSDIRSDSYQVSDLGNDIHHSSFLVDIPSLEQTYSVAFNWQNTNSPHEYRFSIECPYYTDVIYPNTYCQTSNNPMSNLYQYLPTTIDNLRLTAQTYNKYGLHPNQPYLSVDYQSCDDSDTYLNQVKNTVESWLKTRYINYSNIYIEYYPQCNQIQLIEGF